MAANQQDKKKRPLLVRVGKALRPWFNNLIAKDSLVPNTPNLDNKLFPWVAALEKAAPLMVKEFQAVMAERERVPALRDLSPDHRRIAPDNRWKSFFLYGYGIAVPENCAKAPVTAQLVAGIPGLCSALFSILEPGGEIPPHKGVTKGMLNAHMGLGVPRDRDNCWIQVADDKLHWDEGKVFVFDDTYRHTVQNNTDDVRGILFIQFERPTRGLGRLMQRIFLGGVKKSAFVKDAKDNIERWNRIQAELEKA
ncbi:aspartyl/asparaginyl beta-hydroxylase domain-containing protein [Bombella saccharophila]|uniref:Aspartyl/asparaginyl beta-hydroxylase domain-containing protein n=1 Tax=Bombella saccharophila TaxID=2967338 RepID=A0ABT3W3Q6_9PROT|nr:aspartyl/asparaginyl beta-hydroxylase domain-containing protein [Bombella saccharophila]MCX5613677.1 aspartyl/asparaginyl beta-hydroxylase domain-containing protein [Bombella saccharophila]PHI97544.1 aspartyl beta-hydroxylase [Parasaccharibacter apium]